MHSSIFFILLCSCKISAVHCGDGDLTSNLEVQRFILEPVHTGSQTDPLQDSITNQKDEKQQQEQQQQQQDQEKESTNSTSQQQEENENHATDSQHPTQEENTKEKNNQKNKNTLVRVVLPCLIIVFGVCIIWKKIMDRRRQYAGRWIVGSQDPDDDDGFDDDPNETYNTRSFAGMNHTNKSRTWISKEDDWDWEEDSKGEDVEMGLIMTTPTNQRSSSRDGNASSVSSSSMSQKTFPTNNTGRSMSSSVKRRNSVPTKSHGMVSNSNEKEEYQEVSRIQTITGKESHPCMVSVKVNDSWDDDHSDLDEEEEEDEEEEKQKPKQDQTQKQDTGAADISSLPQRPVFRTVTQPPTSLATKEPNQSKVPTVEELLAEQFQNGQRPVITSLSMTKSKVAVEKKQTTSSTNFTKNTDQDDIFASMGLSTIPKIKSDFRQQHLTVSDVKVALPANNVAAAKNYSTPSLAKNAVPLSNYHSSIDIEEEPDWGDDEDLDDLLND